MSKGKATVPSLVKLLITAILSPKRFNISIEAFAGRLANANRITSVAGLGNEETCMAEFTIGPVDSGVDSNRTLMLEESLGLAALKKVYLISALPTLPAGFK